MFREDKRKYGNKVNMVDNCLSDKLANDHIIFHERKVFNYCLVATFNVCFL